MNELEAWFTAEILTALPHDPERAARVLRGEGFSDTEIELARLRVAGESPATERVAAPLGSGRPQSALKAAGS